LRLAQLCSFRCYIQYGSFFFGHFHVLQKELGKKASTKGFLERRKKTRTWLKVWLKAVAILFPVHENFISILHILGRSHALLWSLTASEQKLGWRKKYLGRRTCGVVGVLGRVL